MREARSEIDADHLARQRGQRTSLDAHRLLCQLKFAAGLGLLENRVSITSDDWELARTAVAHSVSVRDSVVKELAQQKREANRGRAESDAERTTIVAERTAEANVDRVRRKLTAKLRSAGDWVWRSELRRGLTPDDRRWFEEAVETPEIEADATTGSKGGQGERYRARAP